MAWIVGIDEAGYGPNLGPLVVAATVWRVEEGAGSEGRRATKGTRGGTATISSPAGVDLYKRLRRFVTKKPHEKRLAIADSKLLYKPGLGLRHLERGVLTALRAAASPPTTHWRDLFSTCEPHLPWHDGFDCEIPVDATPDELETVGERFVAACGLAGVELVHVRARLVFPREFNELTEHHGNKASALSHVSVGLLRQVLDQVSSSPRSPLPAPCSVTCDKHGGRNFYYALLQHHFAEHWIDILHESHATSRYAWGEPNQRVTVTFRVGGEAELATALASMTAKYYRELAMRAFNDYWMRQVPDLRPTAGYYGDAHRFRKAIADRQRALRIDDRDLWRNR